MLLGATGPDKFERASTGHDGRSIRRGACRDGSWNSVVAARSSLPRLAVLSPNKAGSGQIAWPWMEASEMQDQQLGTV